VYITEYNGDFDIFEEEIIKELAKKMEKLLDKFYLISIIT
jgi:hypothetical protein